MLEIIITLKNTIGVYNIKGEIMKNILIEEQDENFRVIDQKELDEINASAEEFDGFTGIRVAGEIVTKQSIINMIDWMVNQHLKARNTYHQSDYRDALTELKQKIEAM